MTLGGNGAASKKTPVALETKRETFVVSDYFGLNDARMLMLENLRCLEVNAASSNYAQAYLAFGIVLKKLTDAAADSQANRIPAQAIAQAVTAIGEGVEYLECLEADGKISQGQLDDLLEQSERILEKVRILSRVDTSKPPSRWGLFK